MAYRHLALGVVAVATAAAVVVACGSDDAGAGSTSGSPDIDGAAPDGGSPASSGGPASDAGAVYGDAVLVVHTGQREGFGQTSRVFLGDGAKWMAIANDQGDAVFTDPAITLPQDVTWIATQGDGPDLPEAWSILGVDRKEIWMRPVGNSTVPTVRGSITGTLVGGAGTAGVVLGGDGYVTSPTSGLGPFNYNLELALYKPVTLNLLGFTKTGVSGPVTKLGLVTGIAFDGGTVQQNVTLDRTLDQTLTVTVTGDAPYGGAGAPTLELRAGGADGSYGFSMPGTLPYPVSLPTPAMTAPLDTALGRRLLVLAKHTGDKQDPSNIDPTKLIGASAKVVGPTATTSEVSFLPPSALTKPTMGTAVKPATASIASIALEWSNDAAVGYAYVRLETPSDTRRNWTVWLPGSRKSFVLPKVKAGNGKDVLVAGERYFVEYRAFDNPSVKDVQDLFTAAPTVYATGSTEFRECDQSGFLDLTP